MSDEYWEIDYSAPNREDPRCRMCRDVAAAYCDDCAPKVFAARDEARRDPYAMTRALVDAPPPRRTRPGYEVRWIAGTTDYEWVPVEPLYRIVWAGNLEADADVALTWPRLLHALRQYVPHTTRRLSAFVARVERVVPNA